MDKSFHARMAPNMQPWASGVKISYNACFTAAQYECIKRGHVPMEMEDKWYVYYEEPHLWFVRSWTGLRVFRVTLRASMEGRGGAGGAEEAGDMERAKGTAGTEDTRAREGSGGGVGDSGHGRGRGRGRGQGRGHGNADGRGRGQAYNDRSHDQGHDRGHGHAHGYAHRPGRGDDAAVVEVVEALWAEQLAKDKSMMEFQVEELKSLIQNLLLHEREDRETTAFQADGGDVADADTAETTQAERKKSTWRFWKS